MNFDGHLPYPSRRQPVLARNAVATSQPLAVQAGIAMLQRGGNAVDAALATAIALTVVEPCSNGIGSDLFAILWDGRELVGLNASGRAPAAVTPQRYAGQHGDSAAQLGGGDHSRRRLGVGRAVAALRRAAVRRPLRAGDPLRAGRLCGVAGRRREMGRGRRRCCRTISASPSTSCRAAARRPPARLWRCPAMARTLESIAATHGNAFYRGELAQAMVAHARANGALHALSDFAEHTVDWVEPLGVGLSPATTVHEIPPNGQGIAALMALGILRTFDLKAAAARFRREPAPADRGDEARLRRCLSLRQRPANDGGRRVGAARPRLPRRRARA